MSERNLTGDTHPVLAWEGDKPTITLLISCHCGEQFGVDELDKAQAHVRSHGEVDEPS